MNNESMQRNDVIRALKQALQKRSGKAWSVTGGRGTAYGWITISSPPARRVDGSMSGPDREELARLLGFDQPVHFQGESIPAGHDFYRLYLHRARYGTTGGLTATPYWD